MHCLNTGFTDWGLIIPEMGWVRYVLKFEELVWVSQTKFI